MTAEALELRELVAGPGVYLGMPDAVYHADPYPGGSLSSTGARKLLPPFTPAHYRWWADHPEPPKGVFDFGHAAHQKVLGVGPEIRRLDFTSRRTNAYKDAEAEAREAGAVPLLPHQFEVVYEMAAALRRHKLAESLLRAELGTPEVSLFWVHQRTGVARRGRVDFLRNRARSGLTINVDYKTCDDASDDACEKAIYQYGLHVQGIWYEAGIQALGLADEVNTLLIFQEKKAPYLVNVIELNHDARRAAKLRNDQALNIYRQCMESGKWPGYGDGVNPTLIGLPNWALKREGI